MTAGFGMHWLANLENCQRKVGINLMKKYLHSIHLIVLRIEWAILRPQLEETIRLRREKTRRECADSRRRTILDIARFMVRSKDFKLLLYDELLELPAVSKIINADGIHKTISEGDIQKVKASVLDLGTKRLQEAADFCGVNMMAAFSDCGLLPSDVMISDCDRDKLSRSSSVSAWNIVNHCCAQFKYKNWGYRPPSTFSELILDHSPESSEKFYERYSPDKQAILIAKRLAEDLGVLHLSSGELALFNYSFVCARCDPLFRKKMDWQALVRCTCSQDKYEMLISPFVDSSLLVRKDRL